MKPIRVLFVCHGDICRSPMAEFVFKKMIKEAGREEEFVVASAATSDEECWNGHGNPIYPPAKAELALHGITGAEVNAKRAVQITKEDYNKYDLIVCMEDINCAHSRRIFGGDPEGKIHKLLDFAGTGRNVADPWYTGDFSTTYKDIVEGCRAILSEY